MILLRWWCRTVILPDWFFYRNNFALLENNYWLK
jgi:hypothetical protein